MKIKLKISFSSYVFLFSPSSFSFSSPRTDTSAAQWTPCAFSPSGPSTAPVQCSLCRKKKKLKLKTKKKTKKWRTTNTAPCVSSLSSTGVGSAVGLHYKDLFSYFYWLIDWLFDFFIDWLISACSPRRTASTPQESHTDICTNFSIQVFLLISWTFLRRPHPVPAAAAPFSCGWFVFLLFILFSPKCPGGPRLPPQSLFTPHCKSLPSKRRPRPL